MGQLMHEELSRVLAAAMKVHSTLKPGLDEKLYENALLIELVKRGHRAEQQKSFSVHYDGHFIGKMTPDLIVDDLVIVDPKVVEEFNQDHFAQMLGYLAITGVKLAILVNFKHPACAGNGLPIPVPIQTERSSCEFAHLRKNPR